MIIYDNIQILQLVKAMITRHDRLFTILALLKEYYKLIAIDLSKQKKIDTSPKAIQKLNFPRNLEKDGDTELFFIIQEVIESILDF